jgi:hypothetical protein
MRRDILPIRRENFKMEPEARGFPKGVEPIANVGSHHSDPE